MNSNNNYADLMKSLGKERNQCSMKQKTRAPVLQYDLLPTFHSTEHKNSSIKTRRGLQKEVFVLYAKLKKGCQASKQKAQLSLPPFACIRHRIASSASCGLVVLICLTLYGLLIPVRDFGLQE